MSDPAARGLIAKEVIAGHSSYRTPKNEQSNSRDKYIPPAVPTKCARAWDKGLCKICGPVERHFFFLRRSHTEQTAPTPKTERMSPFGQSTAAASTP
jgi:hypothetical protein